MSASWKPSDRAVCIKDKPWKSQDGEVSSSGPVKDIVYLVAEVWNRRTDIGLRFAEFEGWYDSVEFRRLVPRCDSADIGQAIETPIERTGPAVAPSVIPS